MLDVVLDVVLETVADRIAEATTVQVPVDVPLYEAVADWELLSKETTPPAAEQHAFSDSKEMSFK